MITLYTTGCPKCKVLEAKLAQKNIEYDTCTNLDTMEQKGFMSVPVLEVDGNLLQFKEATDWVNQQEVR